MDIYQIETDLENPDFQYRLKAIQALKDYPSDTAVPLLLSKLQDPEFLVRSFISMALGKQQVADSFAALLQIMKFDNTPSVRAEAANSLSLFGKCSASHLVSTFLRDSHWLVRRSIFAALMDLECYSELLEVCLNALNNEDPVVTEAAVEALATLAGTDQHSTALKHLLTLADSTSEQIRRKAVYGLKNFDDLEAKQKLVQLRQDPNHQVVAAALETLI